RLHLATDRARGDWPASLPHRFVDPATALVAGAVTRSAPTYVVASTSTIDDGRAGALRDAAMRQGLALVTADDRVMRGRRDVTLDGRVGYGVAELVLALVFGGIATALVLAELRGEARILLLVGARPCDHRLRAAAVAFALAATGVLLAVIFGLMVCAVAIPTGSGARMLSLIAPSFLVLAVAPVILAGGAALLAVTPRRIGRIGRVPRDAAGGLRGLPRVTRS